MRIWLLLIPLIFTALSCTDADYEELINEEGLAVNSGEPGVTIISPSEGEYIRTLMKDESSGDIISKSIILTGYANDGYSNPISETNIVWSSDINGFLGNGNSLTLPDGRLTPGTHRITLSAVDPWGKMDLRTVTVHVPYVVTEDFSTRTYFDSAASTGIWETGTGTHLGLYSKYDLTAAYDTNSCALKVAVSGNYAYVVNSDYSKTIIEIVDVSNPFSPVYKAEYTSTYEPATGIAASGDYAYITCGSDGLITAYTPGLPDSTAIKRFDTDGTANDIALSGNFAFIADGENGLVIINISNPASPVIKEPGFKYLTSPGATGIAVCGDYAYITDSNHGVVAVYIQNLSTNPATPVFEKVYNYTSGTANDIEVIGNYAYVTYGTAGLIILDVRDFSKPVSSYDTNGNAKQLVVKDNYAYIADGECGLVVLNVNNPELPLVAGVYDTAEYTHGIGLSGDYIYVADGFCGLYIFNIVYPLAPALIDTCNTAGISYDVTVKGDYAYVADGENGLVTIDISNPSEPIYKSAYPVSGTAYGVTINEDYIYVASGGGGLSIFDISEDPSNPEPVQNYDTNGNSYNVCISGDYAYVADSTYGITIIDIHDLTNANPLKYTYTDVENARDVAVNGDYAYIADIGVGLVVINISNKNSIQRVTSYPAQGDTTSPGKRAFGVTLRDNSAYIAAENDGLVIVSIDSITNPANLVKTGQYDTTGPSHYVTLSDDGKFAYTGDYQHGIFIINISNPASPVFTGRYNTIGTINGIAVNSDYIYAADGGEGLSIFAKIKKYCEQYYDQDEQTVTSKSLSAVISPYSSIEFLTGIIINEQSLLFEMSYDNGKNWISVTDSVLISMGKTVNDLRWRAHMRTYNRNETPGVTKIGVQYWE